MKIFYQFANGEISEIDVSDELGELLLGLDQQEHNNDRRETRRHVSLDGMDYEGGFFTSGSDTADQAALNMELDALRRAMDTLSPQQRDLVRKVFFEGRSIASVAMTNFEYPLPLPEAKSVIPQRTAPPAVTSCLLSIFVFFSL